MVAGIPSVSSDGRGNVYGCLCCVFSLAAVSGYTTDIISVTKLCTCRSAADRPGSLSPSMCVCVCVWSLFLAPLPHSLSFCSFWRGQDMDVMRGSLQRNNPTDTVSEKRVIFPPVLTRL